MQLLVRAELALSGWRCVRVCVCLYLMCADAEQADMTRHVKVDGFSESTEFCCRNLFPTSVIHSACHGYCVHIITECRF